MKRLIIAMFAFIALLAFTTPIVFAEENPPTSPEGGCTGPGCK